MQENTGCPAISYASILYKRLRNIGVRFWADRTLLADSRRFRMRNRTSARRHIK